MKELLSIQAELKAPKNQFNAFGKYKYRNAEDILEAVKPLLLKYECILILSDAIKETSGGLVYVESTAKFCAPNETNATVTAQAGIDINRKGMDIAQSFGSSSSYSRKYALQGLFLLDDSRDPDATNTHGKDQPTREEKDALIRQTEKLPEERRAKAIAAINKAETKDEFIKLETALKQIKP